MATWDSKQYLRFERERAQACIDLVHRIDLEAPRQIVDLGCGTGSSTAILKRRWPASEVTGVDSSVEMLEAARTSDPSVEWVHDDLESWRPDRSFDLVFSNAALQWLPDHQEVIPRLWEWVAPGGALAFQVPASGGARERWLEALRATMAEDEWRGRLHGDPPEDSVLSLKEYYDLLSRSARRIEAWDTEYCHVLNEPTAVVEWTKGTALRPVLGTLASSEEERNFLRSYRKHVERAYPREPDGRVLFPFLRRFVVAYRP